MQAPFPSLTHCTCSPGHSLPQLSSARVSVFSARSRVRVFSSFPGHDVMATPCASRLLSVTLRVFFGNGAMSWARTLKILMHGARFALVAGGEGATSSASHVGSQLGSFLRALRLSKAETELSRLVETDRHSRYVFSMPYARHSLPAHPPCCCLSRAASRTHLVAACRVPHPCSALKKEKKKV